MPIAWIGGGDTGLYGCMRNFQPIPIVGILNREKELPAAQGGMRTLQELEAVTLPLVTPKPGSCLRRITLAALGYRERLYRKSIHADIPQGPALDSVAPGS